MYRSLVSKSKLKEILSIQTTQVYFFTFLPLFPINVYLLLYYKIPSQHNPQAFKNSLSLLLYEPLPTCDNVTPSPVCQSAFLETALNHLSFYISESQRTRNRYKVLQKWSVKNIHTQCIPHALKTSHDSILPEYLKFLKPHTTQYSLNIQDTVWDLRSRELYSPFVSTQRCHSPAKPFLPHLPIT